MSARARRFASRTRPQRWPGLLALVALVLQPLLFGSHCGPASAHSHLEDQSPFHAHEEVANPDTHHDAHHDERGDNHHDARVDAHEPHRGYSEPSAPASPVLDKAPDHQHELCCSHGGTPFLRATLPVRSSTDESQSVPTPQAIILMSSFKLHVLAGIHSRAGPSNTQPFSVYLASSLLGRAPPVSA